MTPEQAAHKAAETLSQAAEYAQVPDVAGALVGIADGWTRLYAALAHTPTELPAIVSTPEARIEGRIEGREDAFMRGLDRVLGSGPAPSTPGTA